MSGAQGAQCSPVPRLKPLSASGHLQQSSGKCPSTSHLCGPRVDGNKVGFMLPICFREWQDLEGPPEPLSSVLYRLIPWRHPKEFCCLQLYHLARGELCFVHRRYDWVYQEQKYIGPKYLFSEENEVQLRLQTNRNLEVNPDIWMLQCCSDPHSFLQLAMQIVAAFRD